MRISVNDLGSVCGLLLHPENDAEIHQLTSVRARLIHQEAEFSTRDGLGLIFDVRKITKKDQTARFDTREMADG